MTVAGAATLPATVTQALQRAGIPLQAAGVHVQEAGGERMLAELNPATPFNPASTMKLVTTGAALDLLGPAFAWKTEAYARGTMEGDVLQGDLVIKGGGDPKLTVEGLWMFLREIRARGIREIRGNLVLDRSLFAPEGHDPASFDGDPSRPYNAGPDALLFNYKTLTLRFMPNPAQGKVALAVEPPFTDFHVIGPRLGNGDCGEWRKNLAMSQDAYVLDIAGAYPASCGERVLQVLAWNMSSARYFEIVFRRLWSDLGGSLAGVVTEGGVRPDAWLLAQRDSVSLAEVVRDINKFSNNVMARQLLLTLAARYTGQAATVAGGAEVIKTWVASRGIAMPELVLDNGSGLSREGRVSAGGLGRLLQAAFRAPTMPEFVASLPLVGQDGTMRKRLNGDTVAGNAHIKTGYLNEARAIAGYVQAASGKRYVVVFLVNHANAGRASEAQDQLLKWVYENG
ncbi:D-alanyl-D-alanine carboxypeptidase/D-alanyl-D-alanine-endopeptidase (penicillin-binding protein 4) [Paucimonas lemoignei]|uniref:D-alanyl-D-alanine carboxypeptidase/D-alanyl-D-alanine-endopeptidase (Penicillin-binding protein 4) n=1 Tax=Paucimonas lemoignei TaxID=29443 RepID=A0A4R3HVW3_PAULE|nr:D-alanyl-D-alanine carboxypeptidase/D-alanyl-D-alanine-endopeptidase [Paucimonas lemoignei]TCS36215.1 D-alanyl-D-alanine carboxypeptidase/D-alanyl-D-alanine-endopeptidase (penicillin-binding protein 4) [Paucimonas lemoignei]